MADEHLLLRQPAPRSPIDINRANGVRFKRISDDDRHYLIGQVYGTTFRRSNKSESYSRVPPDLLITDTDGSAWTMGFEYSAHGEISVRRNDLDVGEFAQFIEYRVGRVWLFGRDGWRHLSRNRQHFI